MCCIGWYSMSASRIISSTSSSVSFSLRLVTMWRNSAAEMKPLPSLSKTRKASFSSSSSCSSGHFWWRLPLGAAPGTSR